MLCRVACLKVVTPLTIVQRAALSYQSGHGGASMVVVIRHAERHDRENPSWSALASRPQDSPLSERGKGQAKRLGKWLYGRLPINKPLAIFCSPFIRCVQTADAIASELEGLQREGLHTASATQICIEPGLMEDMTASGYALRAELESHDKGYTPTQSRKVNSLGSPRRPSSDAAHP